MQTLQIDAAKARQLYPGASKELKEIMHDSFGEAFFSQKITDRVKTFEDACSVLGVTTEQVLTCYDTVDEKAYKKLKTIIRALNEGWVPDWTNDNQYKWFPYFVHKSGFGLSSHDCDFWITDTLVGSRLCFKSRELAEYAAKQFANEYRDFLTIQ